jgi:hypothetical protein
MYVLPVRGINTKVTSNSVLPGITNSFPVVGFFSPATRISIEIMHISTVILVYTGLDCNVSSVITAHYSFTRRFNYVLQ